MISCPNLLRGRFVPLAILVAIVALLGTALAWNQDEGSDLETIGGPSAPDAQTTLNQPDLSRSAAPVARSDLLSVGELPTVTTAAGGDPAATVPGGATPPTASADPSATPPASAAEGTAASGGQAPGATTPSTAAPTTKATAAPTTKPPPATTSPPATSPPAGCGNPWANLEGCGWAGPGNTGYRSANCPNGLTSNGSSTTGRVSITAANSVVSCQRITGALIIAAPNVTVRDSIVSFDGGGGTGGGAIVVDDGASATIEHVEVDGLNHTHTCVWHQGTSVTIDAMNCHGADDGVFAFARLAYSATSGDNFTIKNSYFHSFTKNAANGHMDGFQTEGASNGVISHNTFLMPTDANAAIAIWDGEKNANNISITGNLMAGAQFTVYANDYHPSQSSPSGGNSVTNITFTNNSFSTHAAPCVGVWGPWYTTNNAYQGGPTDGWHRSGNKILETGASVDGGNPTCR